MNIEILTYRSNSGVEWQEVISPAIQVCVSEGITLIRFHTMDKYIDVWDSVLAGRGVVLNMSPKVDVDECDPDFVNKYFDHPDYWRLELLFEGVEGEVMVTPLKHEYAVAIIPRDMLFKGVDDYTVYEVKE